ncbi:MAG: dihydroxyacetone kinase subunit DhaK [Halodesulfurarchaeum sp.]
MKKFLNDPDAVPDEAVEGYVNAFPDYVRKLEGHRVVVRDDAPVDGKVGVMVGGGSGHEPFWFGYVGEGMYDAVVVGNVFSSPTPEAAYQATKAIDSGEGVLYLLGNYEGDKMNLGMAKDRAEDDGIDVQIVNVTDDVASAPEGEEEERRGIAGNIFAAKIAGAKAERGANLDEVAAAARKANENMRTMGVALTPCIMPSTGEPHFELGEGEMEVGMGIHGEPGVERTDLKSAEEVAETMTEAVLADLPFRDGDTVVAMMNGLGATPYHELFILWRTVSDILTEEGIDVYRSFVGDYCTSIDMKGASLTLMRLDEELEDLFTDHVETPYFSPY